MRTHESFDCFESGRAISQTMRSNASDFLIDAGFPSGFLKPSGLLLVAERPRPIGQKSNCLGMAKAMDIMLIGRMMDVNNNQLCAANSAPTIAPRAIYTMRPDVFRACLPGGDACVAIGESDNLGMAKDIPITVDQNT
jgi:hypothetical protein